MKYFSSVRIDVRKGEAIKAGADTMGNRTKAKVQKNKVAPPFKEAEFDIMYGEGISRMGEVVDFAVTLELIDKAGAWFTVGETRLQGKETVKEYLKDNPEVAKELEDKIRENAKDISMAPKKKGKKAAGAAVDVDAEDFEG